CRRGEHGGGRQEVAAIQHESFPKRKHRSAGRTLLIRTDRESRHHSDSRLLYIVGHMNDLSPDDRVSTALFPFDNSYARLPEQFYARLAPTKVAAPKLIAVNEALSEGLRIDPARLSGPEGVEALAGNRVPEGSEPLAMAYAGHQFGNWV